MAVSSSPRLTEATRFWYETRVSGATRTTPVHQLQSDYWTSLGFTGTFQEKERKFLRKIITDNAQTPSDTRYIATLLREALAALAVASTPRVQENWLILYKTYNP